MVNNPTNTKSVNLPTFDTIFSTESAANSILLVTRTMLMSVYESCFEETQTYIITV